MVDAFRRMAAILTSDPVPQYMSNLFASKFSQRVRNVSQKNFRNMALTKFAALLMDRSAQSAGAHVRQDHQRFRRWRTCWPIPSRWSGMCVTTCSPPGMPPAPVGWAIRQTRESVVDPGGKVVGAENLFIADASVMPEVSRTNTNIPTIMIAERIAEMVRQR